MPPPDLRERVSGTRNEAWFDTSGERTVDEWSRALAEAGLAIDQFRRVIDFGCGCGRALRHLPHRLGAQATLIGLDTDAEAVGWLTSNMPGSAAHVLGPLPPSPLPDRSADLILSHSVFTHLPEDVQLRWLEDLHRVLAPGGVLVASFHGRKALGDYVRSLAGSPMAGTVQAVQAALDDTGFYHVSGRTEAERSFPQYYGAAFHSIGYIARRWLSWFDLVAWYPTFALDVQDVVVLRVKHNA